MWRRADMSWHPLTTSCPASMGSDCPRFRWGRSIVCRLPDLLQRLADFDRAQPKKAADDAAGSKQMRSTTHPRARGEDRINPLSQFFFPFDASVGEGSECRQLVAEKRTLRDARIKPGRQDPIVQSRRHYLCPLLLMAAGVEGTGSTASGAKSRPNSQCVAAAGRCSIRPVTR
jgi:hypothetical protein